MADADAKQHDEASEAAVGLPTWKKALVLISVLLTLLGGGFWAYGYMAGPSAGTASRSAAEQPGSETPGERTDTSLPSTGLAPSGEGGADWSNLPRLPGGEGDTGSDDPTNGDTSGTAGTEASDDEQALWPAAMFRLGFGFFAGFCMGYALRTFFRISFVAIGLLLLMLFGLQYAGLIDVDWSAMESVFDNTVAWLRTNLSGFREFVTGQLPSTAAAIGGVFIGFKK